MIDRLPKWVEAGGCCLSIAAGFVNAVALIGFNHQGVSHLSGISTLVGVDVAAGDSASVVHLVFILLSFVAGATMSGLIIGGRSLTLGPRYAVALMGEAFLLAGSIALLNNSSAAGHYLAAAACGLQNAITSTFSGAIVRTTHVTGLFTDLGVTLGLRLRREPVSQRRVGLYLALIGGFIAGGVLGTISFAAWKFYALLCPTIFIVVIAAIVMALPKSPEAVSP